MPVESIKLIPKDSPYYNDSNFEVYNFIHNFNLNKDSIIIQDYNRHRQDLLMNGINNYNKEKSKIDYLQKIIQIGIENNDKKSFDRIIDDVILEFQDNESTMQWIWSKVNFTANKDFKEELEKLSEWLNDYLLVRKKVAEYPFVIDDAIRDTKLIKSLDKLNKSIDKLGKDIKHYY